VAGEGVRANRDRGSRLMVISYSCTAVTAMRAGFDEYAGASPASGLHSPGPV
jgi:hypothetical protein